MAAFLFYLERDYQVELNHYPNSTNLELTVFFSKTQVLEQCPLLDWPFIQCDEHDLCVYDRVCQWTIPF